MNEIEVFVSPNLELINGILLTSRYNELTRPYVGYGLMTEEENDYTFAVKAFFKPYRAHKIYKVLEAMIPNGFTFSRPVELALAFDESGDFSFRFPLSSLCIAYSGGLEQIREFAALLRELAKESGYFDFFQTQAVFYSPYIQKARETVGARPFVAMLEAEFGTRQHAYRYVVSALMKGNFGLHFPRREGCESDLFSVFSTDSLSLSPAILLHEYAHPFINPLTEKYRQPRLYASKRLRMAVEIQAARLPVGLRRLGRMRQRASGQSDDHSSAAAMRIYGYGGANAPQRPVLRLQIHSAPAGALLRLRRHAPDTSEF